MAYRTECEPRGQWSRISLCELDAAGVVVPGSNRLLHLPTPYGEWGAEDPKLLAWQDRLLLTYDDGWRTHLAELHPCGEVLWSKELPLIAGSKKYADPLRRTVKQVREMDDGCREKNWTFFARGDQLFLNYLVQPHVVYPVLGDGFQFGKPWVTGWQLPAGVEKLLGYSTPVLHDGCFWQAVHTVRHVENEHKHEMRLLGFSAKAPFAVKWITTRPLLVGQKGGDALYPPFSDHQVIFCSSLQREKTGWRVRFSQNDRRLRSGLIEDFIVAQSLVRVKAEKE